MKQFRYLSDDNTTHNTPDEARQRGDGRRYISLRQAKQLLESKFYYTDKNRTLLCGTDEHYLSADGKTLYALTPTGYHKVAAHREN